MFDLEASIVEWRQRMKAAGIGPSSVLEELENHLRETVAEQIVQGAEPGRAFETAVKQLGQAERVGEEFAKLRRPGTAARKKILMAFCLLPAALVILAAGVAIWIVEMAWAERWTAMAVLALVTFHLLSLPAFFWRPFRSSNQLVQAMVQVGVTLTWLMAGVLFMLFLLPMLQLGRSSSIVFWALMASTPIICWLAGLIGVLRPGFDGEGPGWAAPDVALPPRGPWPGLMSSQAHDALATAREEAERWQHDYVGTEHLLLGLLALDAPWLDRAGIDRERVRREIEGMIQAGDFSLPARQPAYTPRAFRALKLALAEARRLHHSKIEPRHLLLGLMREGEGVAGLVLRKLGLQLEVVRRKVVHESTGV